MISFESMQSFQYKLLYDHLLDISWDRSLYRMNNGILEVRHLSVHLSVQLLITMMQRQNATTHSSLLA